MLGKHADHFMLSQMNERITAVPSNAKGQSLQMPDRERAGTSRFVMPSTINPGPDNAINSGWVPGAASLQMPQTIALTNEYRPGDEDARFASHLEGLGDDPIIQGNPPPAPVVAAAPAPLLSQKTMLILGALAIGAYLLNRKKSRA